MWHILLKYWQGYHLYNHVAIAKNSSLIFFGWCSLKRCLSFYYTICFNEDNELTIIKIQYIEYGFIVGLYV